MKHNVTFTTVAGDEATGTAFNLQIGDRWLSSSDLKGYKVAVDEKTGATSVAPRSFKAEVAFISPRVKDLVNEFLAKTETDAVNGDYGVLEVDGWQLKCFITDWDCKALTDTVAIYNLELFSLYPRWRKTTKYSFVPNGANKVITTGIDYPYDFPFDFAGTSRSASVGNVGTQGDFFAKLTFYGPCTYPYARITTTFPNGSTFSNTYEVDAYAASDERIIVDPTAKGKLGETIYKIGAYGEKTNLFDKRKRGAKGSGSYIFEKVKGGTLDISWPQNYAVDLELIEERGVFPWI